MEDDLKYLRTQIDELRRHVLEMHPAKAPELAELRGRLSSVPEELRDLRAAVLHLQQALALEPRIARLERNLDALAEILARKALDPTPPPAPEKS